MKVEHWMKSNVHTASPQDDLLHAWRLMMAYRIRHQPVVMPQAKLVGILSDRNIKKHAPPMMSGDSVLVRQEHLQGMCAEQGMVRRVVTAPPQASMVRAAGIMRSHGIDSLPVVVEERVVGMVTSSDFLEFLARYFGMEAGGRLVRVETSNSIAAVMQAIGRLQPQSGPVPNIMIKADGPEPTAFITFIVPGRVADAMARTLNASAEAIESIG